MPWRTTVFSTQHQAFSTRMKAATMVWNRRGRVNALVDHRVQHQAVQHQDRDDGPHRQGQRVGKPKKQHGPFRQGRSEEIYTQQFFTRFEVLIRFGSPLKGQCVFVDGSSQVRHYIKQQQQ